MNDELVASVVVLHGDHGESLAQHRGRDGSTAWQDIAPVRRLSIHAVGAHHQLLASVAAPLDTRTHTGLTHDVAHPSIALEGGGQEVFLGRDLMSRSDISESISQQIDEQVRGMVKRCYEETVAVVADNREAMDRLVELLIEKETMDGEEFAAVVAEFTQVPEKDRTVVTLD